LETAAKISTIIGDHKSATKYGDQAAALCRAIHARFYRPQTHDYANGHQQYLALALLAHVAPPDEESAVWKRLEEEILVHRDGHIDAGIVGGALLTRLLIDSNRADLMYTMALKDDYPSWGHFLKSGLTTIPESWDETESQLHSSYLFVGAWFMEGLAGIRPGPEGGFQHFVFRPLIDAKPTLAHVAAEYQSLYGPISCSWKRQGGKVELDVSVPPNTSATLYLPRRFETGSGPLTDGIRMVELQAGMHHFQADELP
jgi:alpha-L-rhamnosidase